MTAIIKYVIANKKEVEESKSKKDSPGNPPLNPLYKLTSNIILYGHIFMLTLSLTFCAFNVISFDTLTNIIALIETFLGAYVGIIITDLFKLEKALW